MIAGLDPAADRPPAIDGLRRNSHHGFRPRGQVNPSPHQINVNLGTFGNRRLCIHESITFNERRHFDHPTEVAQMPRH